GDRAGGDRGQGGGVVGPGDVDRVGLGDQRIVAVGDGDGERVGAALAIVEGFDGRGVLRIAVGAGDGVDGEGAVEAGEADLVGARAGRAALDAVGQGLDVDVGADEEAGQAGIGGRRALVDLGDRAGGDRGQGGGVVGPGDVDRVGLGDQRIVAVGDG